MLSEFIKMVLALAIGISMAQFTKKHELSPILGICLVVALCLVSCLIVDVLSEG